MRILSLDLRSNANNRQPVLLCPVLNLLAKPPTNAAPANLFVNNQATDDSYISRLQVALNRNIDPTNQPAVENRCEGLPFGRAEKLLDSWKQIRSQAWIPELTVQTGNCIDIASRKCADDELVCHI